MTDLFNIDPIEQAMRRGRIRRVETTAGGPARVRRRRWWLPGVIALVLALLPAAFITYRAMQLHSFQSAPSCGRVQTDNCWYGVDAIVLRVTISDDVQTSYLRVNADAPADKPIRFEEPEPLLYEIDTGDQVFVEIWHGQVWNVRYGDTTEYTSAAVRFIAGAVLACAALLILGVLLLVRPRRRQLGRKRIRPVYRSVMTFGYATAILFGIFAPITLIGTNPGTIWTVMWPLLSIALGLGLIVAIVNGIRLWWSSRAVSTPDPALAEAPYPESKAEAVRGR